MTHTTNRKLTDELDEKFYRVYAALADDEGGPSALDTVLVLDALASRVTREDIRAWVLRYEHEQDVVPHPPNYPHYEDEYSRMYQQYQEIKRG